MVVTGFGLQRGAIASTVAQAEELVELARTNLRQLDAE